MKLLHAQMLLADADPLQLAAGANLALLGGELIQFGKATPLGGTRWRLERLLRGRRGTGAAAAEHLVGERFVMIATDTLLAWDPPLSAAGGSVRLIAAGIGDASPVETQAVAIGAALRPLAPFHLRAWRRADGGFDLAWTRGSRLGWRWLDGVDAPLGEEKEAFLLRLVRGDGSERLREVHGATAVYPASEVAADRLLGPTVTMSVVQLGTHAPSPTATIAFTLD